MNIENSYSINDFKELFNTLKGNGTFRRLGKTFTTDKHFYFLDTGTGKVAQLNKNVYLIIKCLLETDSFDKILEIGLNEKDLLLALSEIKSDIEKEHILSAPILTDIRSEAVQSLDYILNNEMSNITLEVTEKCNLRCKYCIYNTYQNNYRNFGQNDMDFSIAKKSIDYLNKNSSKRDEIYIGFYGGEPLLNFSVIKESVEYSKKNIKNKKVNYSLTTNATLITKDIAIFLAQNNFNILFSLDGPKEIHDDNRVMIDGTGSFDKAINGIKLFVETCNEINIAPSFGFNIVVSGPDYENKYEKIQTFFSQQEWLPQNFYITSSLVDFAPSESQYVIPQSDEERLIIQNITAPLRDWSEKNFKRGKKQLFSNGIMNKDLITIHNRLLLDNPVIAYGMNGCCVPGQRRVYVTVDGNFLLCEKIGNVPPIGNVYNGFDIKSIKKHYIYDFINELKKHCKDCWAVNLCTLCYVDCYDQNGIHYNYRHSSCISHRKNLEETLSWYHYLLENNPEELQILNEMEVS